MSLSPVLTTLPADRPPSAAELSRDARLEVSWRRLRGPAALIALTALVLGSFAQALGSLVAGWLAERPTAALVWWLAACLVGGALLDTAGKFVWAGVSDRAEGALRDDVLHAALSQPLAELSEQAVGEVLDRVDDDTREVGALVRWQIWQALRAVTGALPMWVIAGLTWWPAWLLFPLFVGVAWLAMRSLLPTIATLKVREEAAWTDHAAALEEGIAGRDDLRTSLGQAFAIGRLARLSSVVHERFRAVVLVERRILLRAVLLLNALLAGVAILGVAMAVGGGVSVAQLVTLFLVTSSFVGVVGHVAQQLPDLQAGLGAVLRLREMLALTPEPSGGAPLADGRVDLRFEDLHFAYTEGTFALEGVTLTVPAGQTLALVGRTGSGKSTLASLVSRAVEPERGSVLIGGVDVLDLDLQALRRAVGVVTQRTDILAGSLHDNITMFADEPRARVEAVVAELGLSEWVEGLEHGLDTMLGPGGTTLSAGEEQLVAFARLLIRDVRMVVLDEATARMDPLTEARVVAASDRLLRGRTGILVAHRLSTIGRADLVAVLSAGRLRQFGPQSELAVLPGPFRDLLTSAGHDAQGRLDGLRSGAGEAAPRAADAAYQAGDLDPSGSEGELAVGTARRRGPVPDRPATGPGPSLARGVISLVSVRPTWGLYAVGLFLIFSLTGAMGAITGLVWGHTVEAVGAGRNPWWWGVATVAAVLVGPVVLAEAVSRYPRWWVETLLRVRLNVLVGQTRTHRLEKVPAGEVVARAMDSDRYARYADRWVDFVNGIAIVIITALVARSVWAGLVLLTVMVAASITSFIGRPIAGRSATVAAAARARFGRALVSVLESAQTVKLAARTPEVARHLRRVDHGRVEAAVREHRVQAVLDGVPGVMVRVGAVAAWAAVLADLWGLATALLVVNAVNGFEWFGRVASAVVTEAPGTRSWQKATSRMAGGVDLMQLPEGVDLVTGAAPPPPEVDRVPLRRLTLTDLTAVHEDGTIGIEDVDLAIDRGELVLLLGQVGSGKSTLLRTLAGLTDYTGSLRWNDTEVDDAEVFLRPGQVAYVAQVPRVLSGTFAENVQLGFGRDFEGPVSDARLQVDVESAGGATALVGHRGVRLSGGQVQRLALARALAADAELLLADDVSSALDARTEIELWQALRERSATVVGATSKRAALAQADRVVVLDEGRVVAVGPWPALAADWGHLAG
ncbi:MAG TPA: ABC transporter ATP-binding protein [Dermatophilaceae bacterium]|nr:ABC transporter ATP-binding protein [Dermatophilaceae bacterium]